MQEIIRIPLSEHITGGAAAVNSAAMADLPATETAPVLVLEDTAGRVASRNSAGLRDLLIAVSIIWVVEILAAVCLFYGFEVSSPLGILTVSLIATACTFLICWYFLCLKYKLPLGLGFGLFRVDTRVLLASILLGAAGAVTGSAVITTAGAENDFMSQLTSTPLGLAVVAFLGVALPPFEELYYRGFIFSILRRRLGGAVSVIVVTLWFTGGHCFQLAGNWPAILFILVMSATWTLQRHLTGSLVPSMVTHWVYNSGLILITMLFERN
jgi:membrane protease YdiL (CAAX protease family)